MSAEGDGIDQELRKLLVALFELRWAIIAPCIVPWCATSTRSLCAETKIVHENESSYILIGAVHRLENPGEVDLERSRCRPAAISAWMTLSRIEDDYRRS